MLQQRLLLLLVEILYLVQIEQHAVGGQHGIKAVYNGLDVAYPGGSGVELMQAALCLFSYDIGHGGLAHAGWAVEYHIRYLAAFDDAAQHTVFAKDMLLTHHLVQRPGPYLVRQRSVHRLTLFTLIIAAVGSAAPGAPCNDMLGVTTRKTKSQGRAGCPHPAVCRDNDMWQWI